MFAIIMCKTTILMAVRSRHVSTDDIGTACKITPNDGTAAAIRGAQLVGFGAVDTTTSAAIVRNGVVH